MKILIYDVIPCWHELSWRPERAADEERPRERQQNVRAPADNMSTGAFLFSRHFLPLKNKHRLV